VLVEAEMVGVIRMHAEESHPEECCGALFGRDLLGRPGGPVRELRRVVPVPNLWEGDRSARYLIPAELVRTLEADAYRAGLGLVGFYHAHPHGDASPSAFDRAVAWPWYSYLIVAVGAEGAGEVRSWRLRDDRSGFEEQVLRVVVGPEEMEE
jgi:proteasome lid subunit RPN8/RPN11